MLRPTTGVEEEPTMTIPAAPLGRRTLLGAGGAALAAGAFPRHADAQGRVAPITIVINQSPWLDSFQRTVALYERETGAKVDLDVNPFAGSLEKQRNSVRARQGTTDLLIMNSGWFAEMYFGGFVRPIQDIDPSFQLERGIYTLGDTIFFDAEKKTMTPQGKLMSMPISPLIPLTYYRADLYRENGIQGPPRTFAQLEANARKLHRPPRMMGIVQRGARGPHTVAYDFYPYLYGFGGSIFRNQAEADYTVTLNNAEGRTALDYYIRLAREAGHPRTAAMDQADVIQAFTTGRTAHMLTVIAAWPQMDDPQRSAIVDKCEWAPTPSVEGKPTAPGLGHWLAGVSRNVPDDRQRAAAAFLNWFQKPASQIAMARLGGIPVHEAAYRDSIADDRRFRWMKPLAEALPHAVNIYQFPEASEVIAVLELGLNRAIAGEITSVAALNGMSSEIADIMTKYNYRTGKLEPLR
jgi:multiple sugar transport system substrate-binding protein